MCLSEMSRPLEQLWRWNDWPKEETQDSPAERHIQNDGMNLIEFEVMFI